MTPSCGAKSRPKPLSSDPTSGTRLFHTTQTLSTWTWMSSSPRMASPWTCRRPSRPRASSAAQTCCPPPSPPPVPSSSQHRSYSSCTNSRRCPRNRTPTVPPSACTTAACCWGWGPTLPSPRYGCRPKGRDP